MDILTRDAYVVSRLAALAAQGVTGRAAVLQVMRENSLDSLGLPGHNAADMDTDLTGLQTAVSDVVTTSVRATAAAALTTVTKTPETGTLASVHKNKDTGSYRMRVLRAGA